MASSPGPWKYCGASEGECHCGLVWEATGAFVVAHVVRDDDDHTKDDATFLANGRLIAAAPELLALVKLVAEHRDVHRDGEGLLELNPEFIDRCAALVARIDPTPTRGGTP